MRISVTERQLFKRCRRKWDLSSYNRQSLTPIVNSPALDLGTLVHLVLAQWSQDPSQDPSTLYAKGAADTMLRIVTQYRQNIGCDPSPLELKPTTDAILLGADMIRNYHLRWHTPIPAGFTLIENELTLIQDIPNAHYCANIDECLCDECDHTGHPCTGYGCSFGASHQLEATFDGVMADANGMLYIIERKTFSRTPNLDELQKNDQFLAYIWALSKQMPNVVGIAYDGLLKKTPTNTIKLEDLFLRRNLLRSTTELMEFETFLAQEANEMANPNLSLYKTVPPVTGCMRWECSFMDVCAAISTGQPTDNLLRMFTKSTHKKHLDALASEIPA